MCQERWRETQCRGHTGGFNSNVKLLFVSLLSQWYGIRLPMQETQVRSLGWEDPLEKGMATHSSILAWRIPWTEEPRGPQSLGSQRVGHD